MFCLIYRSVAVPSFKTGDVQKMLEKARTNNRELGITGCLLYYNGEFIQYLEGNQIKVLALFDKIKKDKRHTKVELISFGEREFREFDKWEMAYEDFYGENDQITYLKLLVSTYFDNPEKPENLHPASRPFWSTVSKLLNASSQPNFT